MNDATRELSPEGLSAASLTTPRLNRRGQQLHGKGQRTRTGIIVETLKMISTGPLAQVTIANLTKRLGIRSAAFYRYFVDIGEVLVAAYECVMDDAKAILPLLEREWSADETQDALVFIDAYQNLWRKYAPLLRARNSFADAGDARLFECRYQLGELFARALGRKLARAPSSRAPVTARAATLIMALERAATVSTDSLYSKTRPWSELRIALAEMFQAATAGARTR